VNKDLTEENAYLKMDSLRKLLTAWRQIAQLTTCLGHSPNLTKTPNGQHFCAVTNNLLFHHMYVPSLNEQ